ncbi:putative ubiquitin carboxyl-terminal hydrolase FAF-X [Portunus trituberculatus]|uniref:Putative ubiquitin carboxyl-terminal hydrolase FAF-X n=1 Tax=Portunus trituberculatus TaxID=210409 RepID=A0A5B7GE77_PORTR|nr:putative ubiquitin carboxyl-terminal hydrolase FAF-X [Portunus trituberculatus]
MAIQLKRFDYDWERECSIKFNDYFEFPRELDMDPYTEQIKKENKALKKCKNCEAMLERLREKVEAGLGAVSKEKLDEWKKHGKKDREDEKVNFAEVAKQQI